MVVKIVELIGESPNNWEEAADNAVKEAAKTLKGLKGVDVMNFTAKIEDGKIVQYRAVIRIAFTVERAD